MTVQIRSFTDKDLSSLVKLLNESYRASYEFIPYGEEKLRSQIQDWSLKILIAEENGEVLGAVAYNNGHWGEEIEWLAVSGSPNRKLVENVLVKEIEKYVKGEAVFTIMRKIFEMLVREMFKASLCGLIPFPHLESFALRLQHIRQM
jgi:N-acetylglutamate synthase-like GNAT family acetyltransferase